jgi:hypothetical protein
VNNRAFSGVVRDILDAAVTILDAAVKYLDAAVTFLDAAVTILDAAVTGFQSTSCLNFGSRL